MFNLKGRVAVVTGASSGLGQQMALALARQGASLAILARRLERLEAFKPKLIEAGAEKVIAIKCDVTSTEEIDAAAKKVEGEFGKVDILLNCAGSAANNGEKLNVLAFKPAREGKIQLDAHPISALRLLAGYRSIIRKEYNGAKAKPVSDLYLGASYNVLKNLSVHIHADNLLNKDYQYYYACRL